MDNYFMQAALLQAQQALKLDEVPIGAVVVQAGKIVGEGFNLKITNNDALAHAEMIALKAAQASLKTWCLEDCTLYVTLEPCAMCVGALVHTRIKRLVFAASDPKSGACGGAITLANQTYLNHKFEITSGVLADEASALLKTFFKNKRKINHET